MKKFLTMILFLSIIITGCASDDNNGNGNVDNDTNTPETIVEPEDDPIEEDLDEVIDEDLGEDLDSDMEADDVKIDIGLEAPDFTLKNLYGDEVTLSDYRGKTVLVNFWATWCHWCDIEMPDINRLDAENEDLVVLAVNVMEDEWTVRTYIQDGGYEIEVVFDTEGDITEEYLITGLPTSFFIDKEGVIQLIFPSMMTYEQMIEVVEAMRDME